MQSASGSYRNLAALASGFDSEPLTDGECIKAVHKHAV